MNVIDASRMFMNAQKTFVWSCNSSDVLACSSSEQGPGQHPSRHQHHQHTNGHRNTTKTLGHHWETLGHHIKPPPKKKTTTRTPPRHQQKHNRNIAENHRHRKTPLETSSKKNSDTSPKQHRDTGNPLGHLLGSGKDKKGHWRSDNLVCP